MGADSNQPKLRDLISNFGYPNLPTDKSLEGLGNAKKYIENHADKGEILKGLMHSVVAQEMARLTVTHKKMVAGDISDVDQKCLISDWQVLSRHYKETQYQELLEEGIRQLKKLTPEEARNVMHEIRCSVEPLLNWAMETKVCKIGLKFPGLGNTELGNFYFTLKGPRVALRRLWSRMARFSIECILWLVVALGLIHWVIWTIFDEPYLIQHFEGTAKLVLFLLVVSTTFIVWALFRGEEIFLRETSKFAHFVLRFVSWFLVMSGWCYWVVWMTLGIPRSLLILDPMAKIALPFFLIFGSMAAWIFARIWKHNSDSK